MHFTRVSSVGAQPADEATPEAQALLTLSEFVNKYHDVATLDAIGRPELMVQLEAWRDVMDPKWKVREQLLTNPPPHGAGNVKVKPQPPAVAKPSKHGHGPGGY